MSINKIFLFSLLIQLVFLEEPPTTYDQLTCGKNSPKKPSDCTKYGTGSQMVCCWISDVNKNNGKCRLVPDQTARDHGINGDQKFDNIDDTSIQYWDCGNKSNYLYLNLLLILFLLFLL